MPGPYKRDEDRMPGRDKKDEGRLCGRDDKDEGPHARPRQNRWAM
jgi:hypothetical protein